jgi:hypothetical protein
VLLHELGRQIAHVARLHTRMLAEHGNCAVNETGAPAFQRSISDIIADV